MPTWPSHILPRPPSPSSSHNPSHHNTRPSNRTVDPDRSAALAISYNVPVLPSSSGPSSNKNNTTTGRGRPHRRSLSQPFPSLMPTSPRKGKGKVTKHDFLDSDDSDDDGVGGGAYDTIRYIAEPRSHSPRKGWTPAEDVVNGKCMTCHSTMRCPRDTKVFRCSICLMVNDLEPHMNNGDEHVADENRPPTPPPKDGSFVEPRLPGMLLSLFLSVC